MSDPEPPILPYQTPTPLRRNFGMRAARASWLAPLAAVLVFLIAVFLLNQWELGSIVGAVLWIFGLVCGIVALATMGRYGRAGILRPALIGLFVNLAMLVLLGLLVAAIMNGLANSVR